MYLELKNVNFSYGDSNVLMDISFSLERGTITGLIGSNGAGKTTTILNIIKKLEPDSGEIIIENKPIKEISDEDMQIAYIPDNPVYYEELTVLEHIKFVQSLYSTPDSIVNDLIKRLDINQHLNKIPSMLSKGTLQKLMLLLAMVRKYKLLIADEPFNGLDPKQISVLKELLLQEKNNNKAVLLSTHLLDVVEDLCDSYIIIDEGRIAAFGSKEKIIREFKLETNISLEQVYLEVLKK